MVDQSKILRRAHILAQEWEGDYSAIMSEALKSSWAMERATSGIKDDFEHLFHDTTNLMRKQAGLQYAYNVLDMSLKNCKRCISATAAGTQEYDILIGTYGSIPRHKNCGCFLIFTDGRSVSDIQREQATALEEVYGDLEDIQEKYFDSIMGEAEDEARREKNIKKWNAQVLDDLIEYTEGLM